MSPITVPAPTRHSSSVFSLESIRVPPGQVITRPDVPLLMVLGRPRAALGVRAACVPGDVFESQRMDALKVGDTAPDFDLPVFGKERVKLSDAVAKGPVVLLAYVF